MHNRKEIIIQAAIRLIGSKGVKATSISEIAKNSGISKSTVFFYFKDKEELVNTVFAYCNQHSIDIVDNYDNDTKDSVTKLLERFDNMLVYINDFYDEALLVQQYTILPENDLYSIEGLNPHYNMVYKIIVDGIEKKEIRQQNPEVLASGYYGFLLQNYMTILKKPEIVTQDYIQACHQFIKSMLL